MQVRLEKDIVGDKKAYNNKKQAIIFEGLRKKFVIIHTYEIRI